MLKQAFLVGFISLAVITFPTPGAAITVQEVPSPRQVKDSWVTDQANILSTATKAELNQIVSQLEAKNGSEIAVVTVPETAPSATPKKFATDLFNYWGIGKKGKDNGVLLLISKGDRQVEIETGYGVAKILPNARVRNIIAVAITPKFKKGDFDGGTLAGTKALVVALKSNALPPTNVGVVNSPRPNLNDQQLIDTTKSTLLCWLAGIGSVGALLAFIRYKVSRRPIFIESEGRSRISNKLWLRRPLHCAVCLQPMKKLDGTSVSPHLSKPEQVAHKIGSVKFESWQCLNCHPHPTGLGMHIRAYIVNAHRFKNCPNCQELTVESNRKVIRDPTESDEGRRIITDDCHCCSYHCETEEIIPCLPPPTSVSSGNDSFSSGSSGGDSFGGGSSGGDGAGGSW